MQRWISVQLNMVDSERKLVLCIYAMLKYSLCLSIPLPAFFSQSSCLSWPKDSFHVNWWHPLEILLEINVISIVEFCYFKPKWTWLGNWLAYQLGNWLGKQLRMWVASGLANQPANPLTNWLTNWLVNQLANKLANQLANQLTNQLANQITNQLANQLVNQLAN